LGGEEESAAATGTAVTPTALTARHTVRKRFMRKTPDMEVRAEAPAKAPVARES